MTDIITIDCYNEVCDANYVRGQSLPAGDIIFVNPEDVDEIFLQLSFFPDRKVVLVSAHSDYGIHYQAESHPNKDIYKIVGLTNWERIEAEQNYIPIQIVTWNPQRCNPTHKFSVKIDVKTICTFDEIPPNVIKWFCCNANINEPQVEFLPFGVNSEGHGKDIVSSYHKPFQEKLEYVYFNLQFNSARRYYLHKYFFTKREETDWLTYVETPNRSIEDFYKEMAEHTFIVNCESNGIDSYRNWEALIVGSIPLVERNRWAVNAVNAGFNFVVVNDLTGLTGDTVTELMELVKNNNQDPKLLTKKFWQEKIVGAKQ